MKIAILLPYKENFSKNYAGAVSIFVNNTFKLSKYKKNILIYGSTNNKPLSLLNYKNILFEKKFLQSSSKNYLNYFLKDINNTQIEILEIHNRPHYIDYLDKNFKFKKILYFHNDPLEMQGSISNQERINLVYKCHYIVFNSNWTKNRFLDGIESIVNNDKITVIEQSTSKVKINFKKKKNLITFIGKLNASKGYDIFGKAIIKILNKYKNWESLVIGDEPRQKLFFNHERLTVLGFKNNDYILNKLKEVSISVIPSKWNEPFGRASLEASSRGCAIIRSNTGGLKETATNTLIIKKFTSNELFKKIELLINNDTLRKKLQKNTYKKFYLTNSFSSKKIDYLRTKILTKKIFIPISKNNLKILHITNFNERFDGRLHYNTGKRINNGLIRLGHNVLSVSDRDIISSNRSIFDPKSNKYLNDKIIKNFNNFNPDLIVLGHADSVSAETIDFLKVKKKNLKIFQWFLDPITRKGPDYLTNKKRLLEKSEFIDASFVTTDPFSLDFHVKNCFFIPNPADKSFEILENYKHDCSYDLFFAMSHGVHRGKLKKGKYDNRENFLKKLRRDENIKFNLFGVDDYQPIWGQNFLDEISKCKMGLNLSRGKPIKYYSSDRIAQLMGNGLLTFIDEKVQYSDFFSKDEIVTYKDSNDLLEKIHKYKKDEKKRKFIAKNGRVKYLKHFNSTIIANFMINKITGVKSKKKFLWDIK